VGTGNEGRNSPAGIGAVATGEARDSWLPIVQNQNQNRNQNRTPSDKHSTDAVVLNMRNNWRVVKKRGES
jgi:hypothetical protein